jgi:hypothetical protein
MVSQKQVDASASGGIGKLRVGDANFSQHTLDLIHIPGCDGDLRNITLSLVLGHDAGTLGMMTCRLHRPDSITSGIFAPTGIFPIVKVPSTLLVVPTIGDPEGGVPTTGQLTPGVNASTAAFGTYTVTFGRGSVPLGA